MHPPRAVIFDLDNTLAEPFQSPSPSMLEKFGALMHAKTIAIMSAATLERITRTVLDRMPRTDFASLTLFTANAAQCYVCKEKNWVRQYSFGFDAHERETIKAALDESVRECGIDIPARYGEQFIDYEGYVAFTALGVGAPREERIAWDPERKKRDALRAALQRKLPQFDVYIGGSTSIDVTPKGINKSFGVTWYAQYLDVPTSDLLYIGDALYEGGNDAVVIPTGIATRCVSGPAETERIIDEMLAKTNVDA